MMPQFKIIHYKTINSTNDKAKELVKKYNNLIIIADKQDKGKGRFKRKWSSSLGGLYMTIGLKVESLVDVKYLTFIAAVSVAKTIKNLFKLNALVKWPNDVLVDDKKICGILTEIIADKDNYALVGIGVNVNQRRFSKSIANKAISLFLKTNKKHSINEISSSIIKNFNQYYEFYKNKKYNEIISIWKKNSHTLGREVKVKTLSGTFVGKAVDVDEDCNLILRLKNGKMKKIVEGDVFAI